MALSLLAERSSGTRSALFEPRRTHAVRSHASSERARLLRQLLERHATELAARKDDLRRSVDGLDAAEDLVSSMMRESRGLGAAMAAIQSRTVQLIETSLRRLESGTYGRCSDCNSPITWARLKALPFADACRDCQERRDQTDGAFPILV